MARYYHQSKKSKSNQIKSTSILDSVKDFVGPVQSEGREREKEEKHTDSPFPVLYTVPSPPGLAQSGSGAFGSSGKAMLVGGTTLVILDEVEVDVEVEVESEVAVERVAGGTSVGKWTVMLVGYLVFLKKVNLWLLANVVVSGSEVEKVVSSPISRCGQRECPRRRADWSDVSSPYGLPYEARLGRAKPANAITADSFETTMFPVLCGAVWFT